MPEVDAMLEPWILLIFLQSTFKIFRVQLKPIMVFDAVASLYVYSKMEEQESRNK